MFALHCDWSIEHTVLAGPEAPLSFHVASLGSQPSWDSRCPPPPSPTRSNAVAGSVGPRILSPARHVATAHPSVTPVVAARGHTTPAAPMDSTVGWPVNHTRTTGVATTTTRANCAQTTQEEGLKASQAAISVPLARTAATMQSATREPASNWVQGDPTRGQSGWTGTVAVPAVVAVAAPVQETGDYS